MSSAIGFFDIWEFLQADRWRVTWRKEERHDIDDRGTLPRVKMRDEHEAHVPEGAESQLRLQILLSRCRFIAALRRRSYIEVHEQSCLR